jgi:hypothetical protein
VNGITLFPSESIQASVFAGLLYDVASETMNKETQPAPDRIDQEILAADALERARLLPPGPERNEALKLASLLRCTVDSRGPVFAKRGRPRK